MEFRDLKKQYAALKQDIDRAMTEVAASGAFIMGNPVRELEAELAHKKGFLEGVRRKLSNEQFVAHAPEAVVAVERKKEADALSAIESIENQLKALRK